MAEDGPGDADDVDHEPQHVIDASDMSASCAEWLKMPVINPMSGSAEGRVSEPIRFLSLDDLLTVSAAALDGQPQIRDWGLLDSALARPRAVVFGESVYPGVLTKAAALVHSLAKNRALVDGDKRTALGALWLFLALNGIHLAGSDDERYAFMLDVAAGDLDDVGALAERLVSLTEPL